MTLETDFSADLAWSLWDNEPLSGAFDFDTSNGGVAKGIVRSVARPWLFGYTPQTPKPNGPAVLILAGGGYIELHVGREGIAVAKWLKSLGFHAFVLVHQFPNKEVSAQAPLDDARRALRLMQKKGYEYDGIGVCGLSSGGHLGAALLARYPVIWTEREQKPIPSLAFAIIGYGPVSTNAKGRHVVSNKPPLEPPEKQELYDVVQADVQLLSPAPPTFIVYSGNDRVVPVVNAYRLADGVRKAGGEVEVHVFADAPHGFGLDTVGLPVGKWPGMCERWLEQIGGWGT